MDEHIHLVITLGLRFRDVDFLTVQEDNRTGISEYLGRINDRIGALRRIVIVFCG